MTTGRRVRISQAETEAQRRRPGVVRKAGMVGLMGKGRTMTDEDIATDGRIIQIG
ncbi:hypothetical protein [Burkholderia ubonensis]|uniref:hypothetical protein n=1 Tax=Burkholderia ubonensis TaxID=101571 RepID=UPI000A712000|nr:hypothetical protein [Burkholderia ubonensis]